MRTFPIVSGVRWQFVLAIVTVPFLLLSFFAPFVSSASESPMWHPHQLRSTSSPSPASPRRAAARNVDLKHASEAVEASDVDEANLANQVKETEEVEEEVEEAGEVEEAEGANTEEREGLVSSSSASAFTSSVPKKKAVSVDHLLTLCDGHDNLPNWVLKQCDPKAVSMVKDFLEHEHLLGTDQESTILEEKMRGLQNTKWRDGTPIALWSDNASELKHFSTSDPAEMMKIMSMVVHDAPMHIRHYLELRALGRVKG